MELSFYRLSIQELVSWLVPVIAVTWRYTGSDDGGICLHLKSYIYCTLMAVLRFQWQKLKVKTLNKYFISWNDEARIFLAWYQTIDSNCLSAASLASQGRGTRQPRSPSLRKFPCNNAPILKSLRHWRSRRQDQLVSIALFPLSFRTFM